MRISDLTRGLSQRIEGQYRRHWGFIPGLWNLYFRQEINLGVSLKTTTRGPDGAPGDPTEQDAAMAAANLYEKLETGTVWVNEFMHLSPFAPFGGHKQSGFGAEYGLDGMKEFTYPQVITIKKDNVVA